MHPPRRSAAAGPLRDVSSEAVPVSSPLSAFAQYRTLPTLSSTSWMTLAVAARAPYAMVPLGVMTAITASTGSIATGGLATGIASLAGAVAGPLIGRAADHLGQRMVLTVLVPLSAIALLALTAAALTGLDGPALWALCLFLGSTSVPIGSFARARWSELARNEQELSTAFSYESTVDEMTFVLGPALVGLAASTAVPWAPLALAGALVLCAGIPFALSSPARPLHAAPEDPAIPVGPEGVPAVPDAPVPAAPARAAVPPIRQVLLAVLPAMLVIFCIGANFGAVQAAITDRAAELGADGAGGLVYAAMGVSSAAMALAVVLIPPSVRLGLRILVGGIGLTLALIATATVAGLAASTIGLLLVGVFVGPTMVTSFTVAERRAPAGGTAVAMTSMQSAVVVGVSTGAMLGGALAAQHGATGAFAVAIGGGVVIALAGAAVLARR